jgi:hypothetical protein
MAHSYHHALSSVKRWGGEVNDYMAIHNFFDETKAFMPDFRHRALRHHSQGIFECERKFGETITNSDGRTVPVRLIGEQHVREDLGRIPSVEDWLTLIRPERWMGTPEKLDDYETKKQPESWHKAETIRQRKAAEQWVRDREQAQAQAQTHADNPPDSPF